MFFKIIPIVILKNTNAKQRLGFFVAHGTLLKFQELLNSAIHSKTQRSMNYEVLFVLTIMRQKGWTAPSYFARELNAEKEISQTASVNSRWHMYVAVNESSRCVLSCFSHADFLSTDAGQLDTSRNVCAIVFIFLCLPYSASRFLIRLCSLLRSLTRTNKWSDDREAVTSSRGIFQSR